MIASRRIPVAIIIGLTLLSGIGHGYLDGRWSQPEDLIEIGGRLGQLPQRCGEWAVVATSELDESAVKLLRCYGSEVRTYRHEKTGDSLNVAVIFGPRGPVAVHTPEVCYSSVGTKLTRQRETESITTPAGVNELWSVEFAELPNPDPSLEVWYAWSDGGPWQAAEQPRFWITDSLFKIQVAGPVGEEGTEPCRDFLTEFLPQLEQIVE